LGFIAGNQSKKRSPETCDAVTRGACAPLTPSSPAFGRFVGFFVAEIRQFENLPNQKQKCINMYKNTLFLYKKLILYVMYV